MIELVVLGATLAFAAAGASAGAHRRASAARTFEHYARSRGLTFVPPPREPRGSSPRVQGSREGVDFVVDLYRFVGQIRTRVSIVSSVRAPRLEIVQRGAFARALKSMPSEVVTGIDGIDRAYRLERASSDDAESIGRELGANLLLLDRRSDVWLSSAESKISVSWAGIEGQPVILDAARDIVVAVAGWRYRDSPYR